MSRRTSHGQLEMDGVVHQIVDIHVGALVRLPGGHLRLFGVVTLSAPGEGDQPQTLVADLALTPLDAAPEKLRSIATGHTMSVTLKG